LAKLDKLLENAREHLSEGEEVLATVMGAYETKIAGNETVRTGIFTATNKRLLFYAKKMLGYDLESFPYDHISSFEMSKGPMGHKMSFFASGNKVTMKWITKGDIPTFTDAVRSRMGKVSAAIDVAEAPAASESATQPDVADQLRTLASLRDEGILTEDEFQAKKADLLAKL
jgi:predicted secreted protein